MQHPPEGFGNGGYWCKPCVSSYGKDLYAKNADRYKATAKASAKRRREWIWEMKSGPCTDCGQTFHPVAMDFDHTDDGKLFSVSRNYRFSLARLQAEIAKCELVCANCHRVRTWTRQQELSDETV